MTSEALKRLLKVADYLEKSSAPDIADEIKKCVSNIKEVLDVFKKYLKIEINDKPIYDGSYMISLENDMNDYVLIFVTEKEKDLVKEWLNNE